MVSMEGGLKGRMGYVGGILLCILGVEEWAMEPLALKPIP